MWFLLPILLSSFLAQSVAAGDDAQRILDQLESRLTNEPANPRLLAARGIALGHLGRDGEGLQTLEKALTISPKFLPALEGAAEISYRGHNPKAAAFLTRVLELEPNNAAAHGMTGAMAFEKGDCAAAMAHFSRADAVITNDSLALAQWGECLIASNRPASGVERLRASLALHPGNKDVAYDLALALHLAGKHAEALQAAAALSLDSEVENLRGSIYASQNLIPEAIAAFRKAAELDPKNEQNYIDLASICLDHQSFDVAKDVVNAGIANLPDSAALYTLRGAIAAQTSDVEQSAADFERARRLQPDRSYGDVGLSLLLRQQDQIEQAIAVIRPRLKKSPGDAMLNFLLADLLMRKSEDPGKQAEREARKLLTNAVRLQPELAKAHAALGKLLFQAGEADPAASELKRALQLDPGDRVALNQYVLVLRRLNRNEEARAAAQQLRGVLTADRKNEVEKNRFRLVRLPAQ